MTNIYWPVYKNLETEVIRLSYAIHIDDKQSDVYSSNISDLILRASAEIESISKELYKSNGGMKTGNIKYDEDAIKHLNTLWSLDKKVVLISSPNCFQSNRELIPFVKNEPRASNGRMTFTWNYSYQNLKHDRGNSLHFGSVKYLFDIMAALFILNLYFKDETYDFEKDSKATSFPINMGSELFAIKLHKWTSYDGKGTYKKNSDFEECLYLTKMKDDSRDKVNEANKKMQEENMKFFLKHPKFLEWIKYNKIEEYTGNNLQWDVLGEAVYVQMFRKSLRVTTNVYKSVEYEAIINKNSI